MTVYVTSPHDVMPINMRKLWMRNTPLLDGAEVQYYNEDAMAASVKEISAVLENEADVHGAWEAFQNLRPGAYRADLWRIMMLWAKGGIYLDCDLELQMPITSWLKHSDSTLFLVQDCQDIKGQDGLAWAYWNAMMAATPRHKILQHMIGKIVDRLHAHYYAEDQTMDRPLSITGPRALRMALESYTGSIKTMSQRARFVLQKGPDGQNEPTAQLDGRPMVKHNQAMGLEKDYKLISTHYGSLFWLHLVYCDEGNLPCTAATQHYLAEQHARLLQQNTTTAAPTTTPGMTIKVKAKVDNANLKKEYFDDLKTQVLEAAGNPPDATVTSVFKTTSQYEITGTPSEAQLEDMQGNAAEDLGVNKNQVSVKIVPSERRLREDGEGHPRNLLAHGGTSIVEVTVETDDPNVAKGVSDKMGTPASEMSKTFPTAPTVKTPPSTDVEILITTQEAKAITPEAMKKIAEDAGLQGVEITKTTAAPNEETEPDKAGQSGIAFAVAVAACIAAVATVGF